MEQRKTTLRHELEEAYEDRLHYLNNSQKELLFKTAVDLGKDEDRDELGLFVLTWDIYGDLLDFYLNMQTAR